MDTSNNIFNNELFKKNDINFYKPFGLNVHVPEKTIKQISQTIKEEASKNIKPAIQYLAKNEDVFSGKVAKEIKSLNKQSDVTTTLLSNAEKTKPVKFEMHM